ncbi:MAG: GtrA family protein [Oscillospiraceae bacterium]|nr:GtrA family protein [Oscillospiraceae bacterium]
MMETIKNLLEKYKEQWHYLIVGVCTTLVNYLIYTPLISFIPFFKENYQIANALAWAGAVAFAYFANGAFVYNSTNRRGLKEAGAFVLSRVFSLVLEALLLALMVELLHLDKLIAKLAVSVVTIVVNYLTGKLVFKKR